MVTAIYPGSFDPLHNGHLDVISSAAGLFDDVVVAAMRNPAKAEPLFSDDERVAMIAEATGDHGNVSVVSFGELVVTLARRIGADVIVKGLRSPGDFETEQRMAQTNHSVGGVETVFLLPRPEHAFVASNYIREMARFGGDCSHLVPPTVADRLRRRRPPQTEQAECEHTATVQMDMGAGPATAGAAGKETAT